MGEEEYGSPAETPADTDLEKAQRELQCACVELGIPANPYVWTVEQVERWAEWTLKQYQLPLQYLRQLHVDGTSLCMLSEDDFRLRAGDGGPYLFAQLEFWKSAFTLTSEPSSLASSPSSAYSEATTYTNLETVTTSSSHYHSTDPPAYPHHAPPAGSSSAPYASYQ